MNNIQRTGKTASDSTIPLSVGGAQLKNEEMIKDAFDRDVTLTKRTATALLIREIIIFITAGLVLTGTIVGTWYYYHKRNQAAELAMKQKIEMQRLADEARKKADAERKKAWEEQRLALEAERKRAEAERIAKLEAKKAERERRQKFNSIAAKYREQELDFLQNAPKQILPGSVQEKTTYSCLMANDVDDFAFFQVNVVPGEPMTVQALSPDSDPVDFPKDKFDERCKNEPYLMIASGRPYVKTRKRVSRTYPVPQEDANLCPAMEDFGSGLHSAIKKLGIKTKFIRYDVVLVPKEKHRYEFKPIQVGQVGFNSTLFHEDFRKAVRAKLEEKAAQNADHYLRKMAARGNTVGKSRAERAQEATVAATEAHLKSIPQQRTHYTRVYGPYGTIYSSQSTKTVGPTKNQIERAEGERSRLRSLQDARASRQARADARRNLEMEKFYRENAVTDEKIDAFLSHYVVAFQLAK